MYRDMAKENDKLHDEFACTFSTLDANFVTRTNELHSAVNDWLMQDRENKEATDAIAETSIKQRKNETPKKVAIIVPSLASIEEMMTLFPKNILSEDASSMEKRSGKQGPDEANNRTPFLEVPALAVEFINWMSLAEYECVKLTYDCSTQAYFVLD
ncbi:hypothetical protein Bca52824_045866 [Brassica carinata]|uniref:Uncharacterized protein n=1 Tax=Brassica carinata TaxID=52824 RepID=A0A8X7UPK4_BRACI|nr:hypothetical protein Bca52824_045866 [Brassica carinata]